MCRDYIPTFPTEISGRKHSPDGNKKTWFVKANSVGKSLASDPSVWVQIPPPVPILNIISL